MYTAYNAMTGEVLQHEDFKALYKAIWRDMKWHNYHKYYGFCDWRIYRGGDLDCIHGTPIYKTFAM